jgi:hypothetical protein
MEMRKILFQVIIFIIVFQTIAIASIEYLFKYERIKCICMGNSLYYSCFFNEKDGWKWNGEYKNMDNGERFCVLIKKMENK